MMENETRADENGWTGRPAPADRQRQAAFAGVQSDFAGQLAVISGASGGVGRAIAGALAARGATVALLGRRRATLEDVAGGLDGSALIFPLDLSVAAEIEAFATQLARAGLSPDILIHSAGVIGLGAIEKAPFEQFEWQLRVNLNAPYLLTQKLLPALKARRGQVVFLNSNAGLNAVRCSGQYSASKHALRALADSLRQEVNGDAVRVLNVFIGRTATPMQAKLHGMEGKSYAPERLIQPADVASMIAHALALPRTVEVTAIHMRPMSQHD
jgi:NADP-dependent 3-hydroxy acid dehydrogenase YdfG